MLIGSPRRSRPPPLPPPAQQMHERLRLCLCNMTFLEGNGEKMEDCRGIPFKRFRDGGFSSEDPSDANTSWVPHCCSDHKDVLYGGLHTLPCRLRLIHTWFSVQARVFDVYLIILGTLSGSAAPSVTSTDVLHDL